MDENRTGPLISTEGEGDKPKARGGCLSNILTVFGVIFIVLILLRSCGGNRKAEDQETKSTTKTEVTERLPAVEDIPQTASYDVTIVLNYEEVPLTTNSPINLCVDDQEIGRQDAGTRETYTINLDEGEHKFYLKNDGIYSTEKLSFDVSGQSTSFQFGAKTRLTFGVEIWEDTEDQPAASTVNTGSASLSLDENWTAASLAKLGDYTLSATLSQELLDSLKSMGEYGYRSDIEFLDGNLLFSATAELHSYDNEDMARFEQVQGDLDKLINIYFAITCDALVETASEACADYSMQVSEPKIENRTNGDTNWQVCTCTGTNKKKDMNLSLSTYFYMDEYLKATVTVYAVSSANSTTSDELEAFYNWCEVFQSSLELNRETDRAGQTTQADKYVGLWEDIGGYSCMLEISPKPVDGYYDISIVWWMGTQYNIVWSYAGEYNEATGEIECYHGSRIDSYKLSMSPETEEIYSDSGEARISSRDSDKLEWVNNSENLSEEFPDMAFIFQKSEA